MPQIVEVKTVRKFIKEYEGRVEDCDTLLDSVKERKRKLRRGEECNSTKMSLAVEFARESSKRQDYIQFITVLKSELLGEF